MADPWGRGRMRMMGGDACVARVVRITGRTRATQASPPPTSSTPAPTDECAVDMYIDLSNHRKEAIMSTELTPQQEAQAEKANPTNEDQPFDTRLEHALADQQMHAALERFAPSWRESRAGVFSYEEGE